VIQQEKAKTINVTLPDANVKDIAMVVEFNHALVAYLAVKGSGVRYCATEFAHCND
jgi:hypothetical protein